MKFTLNNLSRIKYQEIKKITQKMQNEAEFVFIPGKDDDLALADEIEKESNLKITKFTPDFQNYFKSYFALIKKCDFLIAARYHIIILAMIFGKPIFALSYSEKTNSLLKDFKEYINPISKINNSYRTNKDNMDNFLKNNLIVNKILKSL